MPNRKAFGSQTMTLVKGGMASLPKGPKAALTGYVADGRTVVKVLGPTDRKRITEAMHDLSVMERMVAEALEKAGIGRNTTGRVLDHRAGLAILDAERCNAVARRNVVHALVKAGLDPAGLYQIEPDGTVTLAR